MLDPDAMAESRPPLPAWELDGLPVSRPSRRGVLCAGGAVLAAACNAKAPPAPSLFEGKAASLAPELLEAQPEIGLSIGAPGAPRTRLFDRTPSAIEVQKGASLRRAAQWRAIDRALLDPSSAWTYDAIDAHLAAIGRGASFEFGRFDPIAGFSPFVLDHRHSAFVALPGVLKQALAGGDLAEASMHVQRLRNVAAAIDGELASTRSDSLAGIVAPDTVLQRAQDIAAAMLARAPSDTVFVISLRDRLSELKLIGDAAPNGSAETLARKLLADAETIVGAEIFPAYRRAFALLADLRLRAADEPGVARLPGGTDYYRACLRLYTSLPLEPAEMHQLAIRRVAALSGQLDMMQRSQGLAEGDVGQRLGVLTAETRFRYPETGAASQSLVADLHRYQNRIAALLPRIVRQAPNGALHITGTDPGDELGYRAGSIDGKRAAALIVNVGAAAQIPRFTLAAFMHREALPGRHLAAQIAQRANPPLLRRILPGYAFRFGWSSYAEQLADEMGLYENDPYPRIGALRSLTLNAARAVIDTGVHAMGWDRQKAIDYLMRATGISALAAEDEVARCAAAPGLACADEAGRQEIVRLRDESRAALGARFDVRDFHEMVLAHGELPLEVLRAVVASSHTRI